MNMDTKFTVENVFDRYGSVNEAPDVSIITDKETGLEYICVMSPTGIAITPRMTENRVLGIYHHKGNRTDD